MHPSHVMFQGLLLPALAAVLGGLLPFAGCSPDALDVRPDAALVSAGDPAAKLARSPGEALILQESEGERRVRRPRPGSTLTAPFIIKVDPRS